MVGLDLLVHQVLLFLPGAVAVPDNGVDPLGSSIVKHLLEGGVDPAVHSLTVGQLCQLYRVITRQFIPLVDHQQVPVLLDGLLPGKKVVAQTDLTQDQQETHQDGCLEQPNDTSFFSLPCHTFTFRLS